MTRNSLGFVRSTVPRTPRVLQFGALAVVGAALWLNSGCGGRSGGKAVDALGGAASDAMASAGQPDTAAGTVPGHAETGAAPVADGQTGAVGDGLGGVSPPDGHPDGSGDVPRDPPIDARVGGGRETGPEARVPVSVCTPGKDETCVESPARMSYSASCRPNGTCACVGDYVVNPATGRCKPVPVCAAGQVCMQSACVATNQLGCASSCDQRLPSSCPAGWHCDNWGATPTCGMTAAAAPACLPDPSTSGLTGPLRISPTVAEPGKPVRISVEGAPFYIGALYYVVRINGVEGIPSGGGKCQLANTFPALSVGVYAVEVSQYGGKAPWILAGFLTVSPDEPPAQVQPGFPCSDSTAPEALTCIQAAPFACSCIAERCQCQ